jgi:hypothetical protein
MSFWSSTWTTCSSTPETHEQYLHIFCNFKQNDWFHYLPLAEFTYNNSVNSTTQLTPFYAESGIHPLIDPAIPPASTVPSTENHVRHIQSIILTLQDNLTQAQQQPQLTYACFTLARRLLFMPRLSMKSSASWTWRQYGVRPNSSFIGRVIPLKNGLGNLFATLKIVRSWSTPLWRVLFPNLFLLFLLLLISLYFSTQTTKHTKTQQNPRKTNKNNTNSNNKKKKNDRNHTRHLFAVGSTGTVLLPSQVQHPIYRSTHLVKRPPHARPHTLTPLYHPLHRAHAFLNLV